MPHLPISTYRPYDTDKFRYQHIISIVPLYFLIINATNET